MIKKLLNKLLNIFRKKRKPATQQKEQVELLCVPNIPGVKHYELNMESHDIKIVDIYRIGLKYFVEVKPGCIYEYGHNLRAVCRKFKKRLQKHIKA